MNFQTTTVTVLTISNSVEEWRAVLADDTAFKLDLRAKLAEVSADADTPPGNIAYSPRTPYRVDGKQIARAAKKQNKKIAKRFLAKTGAGAFPCDQCDKTFDNQKSLNIHRGKAHNGKTHYAPRAQAVRPPTTELRRHENTFPIAVQSAESDIP